jgi:hypothetical protein
MDTVSEVVRPLGMDGNNQNQKTGDLCVRDEMLYNLILYNNISILLLDIYRPIYSKRNLAD